MIRAREQDRVTRVASGLYCSAGRDVFCGDGATSTWLFALPDDFSAFGVELLEAPQLSPDGTRLAFVALRGQERHIGIAELASGGVRMFPYVLASVYGMSWSPDGSRLSIVADDPAVGTLSLEKTVEASFLSAFSLFVVNPDAEDLTPVAGPVVLPGMPRWSLAGDAMALVTQHRAKTQVLSIVTLDGQSGSFLVAQNLKLGQLAWMNDGHILCAATAQDGLVHVLLVNSTTGSIHEVDKPWDDIGWLTLLGDRVIVAGRIGESWVVAQVAEATRTTLTELPGSISDAGLGSQGLWILAQQDDGQECLLSLDLHDGLPRIHAVASSIRGLRVRHSGAEAAALVGNAGQESACVFAMEREQVQDIGHRDMIVGWADAQKPFQRPPRLTYLLDALSEPVALLSEEPEEPGLAQSETPPASGTLGSAERRDREMVLPQLSELKVEQNTSVPALVRRRKAPWILLALGFVIIAIVVGPMVSGLLSRRKTATDEPPETPDIVSNEHTGQSTVAPQPSSPPAEPTDTKPDQTTPVTSPNASPVASTPSKPSSGSTARSTSATLPQGSIAVGKWVAATESLHVRQGAGTGQPILGDLSPSGRAKVLAGPSKVGGMLWWRVQCYDAAGKQTLSGWVSGAYLRLASAPVTSSNPTKPPSTSFVAPAQGTLLVSSSPEEAIITVDGSIAGTTPDAISLPYGTYDISLVLEGYMVYNTSVTLKKPSSESEVKPVEVDAVLIELPAGQ